MLQVWGGRYEGSIIDTMESVYILYFLPKKIPVKIVEWLQLL